MIFKKLWGWVSSPIKSFGKALAAAALRREGAALYEKIRAKVEREGPEDIDHLFDGAQANLEASFMRLPLVPMAFKVAGCRVIEDFGNQLQEKAKAALLESGLPGLDAVVAQAIEQAVAKVEAL